MKEEEISKLVIVLSGSEFASIEQSLVYLDQYLTLRTYIDGYTLSKADSSLWSAIRGNNVARGILKKSTLLNLTRWWIYIEQIHPEIQQDLISKDEATKAKKPAKSNASYKISLQDAEVGKVVTRFCPEPSGYLHVGHAKAALLNDYFAHDMYKGILILRFDDTNPSKEKQEYEQSISEDVAILGIRPDRRSYTSDHFQFLYESCLRLIEAGSAYADDTDQDTMRDERTKGKPSVRRDRTVDENVRIFKEMLAGSNERNCIRAKISVDNPNKAMRDPVIYRCNHTPHERTGSLWKAYPTYDFACPLVDSREGVTHALRSTEFADRNAQYQWVIKSLNVRKVHIWDFGRLNFKQTFMSKRKLAKLVDTGRVWGWDDPRMPTIRGVVRRGMTILALREFILQQGPSRSVNFMDWTIFWSINKKFIEPVAPRHTAIDQKECVKVTIIGQTPNEAYTEAKPKHSKNIGLGLKTVAFSRHLILEQEDARSFKQGEELTLMSWGNAIVQNITRVSSDPHSSTTHLELELHLNGDFKKTEKKITWLSTEGQSLIPVSLVDFDYLITKDKLQDGDNLEDFLTERTEFKTQAFCDGNLADCVKGDIIQLERKGYYRVDTPFRDGEAAVLFHIPTGKTK